MALTERTEAEEMIFTTGTEAMIGDKKKQKDFRWELLLKNLSVLLTFAGLLRLEFQLIEISLKVTFDATSEMIRRNFFF